MTYTVNIISRGGENPVTGPLERPHFELQCLFCEFVSSLALCGRSSSKLCTCCREQVESTAFALAGVYCACTEVHGDVSAFLHMLCFDVGE